MVRRSASLVRTLASLLVVATVAAHPRPALAQSAADQAAAEALFEEGRRLLAAGSLKEACSKFAESQRLDPGAGTLLNLGACYEKNGQTASAWVTYKEAVASAERSGRKEWAQKATERIQALGPSLSRVSVVVAPEAQAIAGLVVKRDGAAMVRGEWSVAIPIDPGSHTFEASAPGRKTWTSTVTVKSGGDKVTVMVNALESEAVATTTNPVVDPATKPPETPATSGSSGLRTAGLVVGGAGLVGVGVGAVVGLLAMGDAGDAKAFCNADQSRCTQDGIDGYDRAKGKATVSTIAFVAGGVLTASGVALYFLAPKAGHESTTGSRILRVGTVAGGPGSFGLTYGASF
ncbi:MAG: hypothetical protein U0169_00475 [Polyangiaceae bacterium]